MCKMMLILGSIVTMGVIVDSSQTMMKDMTKKFLKAYGECQQELGLPEATGDELAYFWKDGHEVKSREAGCAIMCLSKKMDILDPEGKIHHGKTADFIKEHGADEATAQQVIEILHACEKSAAPNEDHCFVALDIANCFKKDIHKLNWAPDSEILLEELMAEMTK